MRRSVRLRLDSIAGPARPRMLGGNLGCRMTAHAKATAPAAALQQGEASKQGNRGNGEQEGARAVVEDVDGLDLVAGAHLLARRFGPGPHGGESRRVAGRKHDAGCRQALTRIALLAERQTYRLHGIVPAHVHGRHAQPQQHRLPWSALSRCTTSDAGKAR